MRTTRFGRLVFGALGVLAITVQATGCATDLGTLGGPGSDALASTAAGVVVGYSVNEATPPQAFVWDAVAGMRPIDPTSPTGSAAVDVSGSGLVLLAEGPPLQGSVAVWDLATGTKRTSGLGVGSALAVNDAGSVLMTAPRASRTPPYQVLVTLLNHADGTSDLVPMVPSMPTSLIGEPGRLNDRGEVAGDAEVGGVRRAAVWSAADGLRPLDLPAGYTDSAAGGINDAGVVVGSAFDTALGRRVPVSWPSATGPLTRQADLGGVAGLLAVNADGVAIGTAVDADGRSVSYWTRLGSGTAAPAPAGALWRSIGDDGYAVGQLDGRATRWFLGT